MSWAFLDEHGAPIRSVGESSVSRQEYVSDGPQVFAEEVLSRPIRLGEESELVIQLRSRTFASTERIPDKEAFTDKSFNSLVECRVGLAGRG
jgi:hypothetical protein